MTLCSKCSPNPRGVAVVGASPSPEKLGYPVLNNVIQYGYEGGIYPINPKAPKSWATKPTPSCSDPRTRSTWPSSWCPPKPCPPCWKSAGRRASRAPSIITAGFREVGPAGKALEQQVIEIAKRYGMRMVGPNVLGIIDTVLKLNASFAAGMPRRGQIAFMSQSGALCTSILDMALGQGIGFSRFYSIGNKADLNEIDLLQAWAEDPETSVIIAYLEGITNGPEFIKVAREVTRHKPIIAIKSGTTSAGSQAVSSHTGTLAGSEAAYDAAFKQVGIIRAGSVQDLFDYAQAFARQPLLEGDAIAVVTNAGGPGIMASDAIERAGLRLASLTPETKQGAPGAAAGRRQRRQPDRRAGRCAGRPLRPGHRGRAERSERRRASWWCSPRRPSTQIPETAEALGKLSQAVRQAGLRRFMGDVAIRPGVEILRSLQRAQLPGARAGRGGDRRHVATPHTG